MRKFGHHALRSLIRYPTIPSLRSQFGLASGSTSNINMFESDLVRISHYMYTVHVGFQFAETPAHCTHGRADARAELLDEDGPVGTGGCLCTHGAGGTATRRHHVAQACSLLPPLAHCCAETA